MNHIDSYDRSRHGWNLANGFFRGRRTVAEFRSQRKEAMSATDGRRRIRRLANADLLSLCIEANRKSCHAANTTSPAMSCPAMDELATRCAIAIVEKSDGDSLDTWTPAPWVTEICRRHAIDILSVVQFADWERVSRRTGIPAVARCDETCVRLRRSALSDDAKRPISDPDAPHDLAWCDDEPDRVADEAARGLGYEDYSDYERNEMGIR